MTIDIARLEDQLLQMSVEGAPGREFCEAISELARTGRFAQLREDSARHRLRRTLDCATSIIQLPLWLGGASLR